MSPIRMQHGRVVSVLEGGYNPGVLAGCVEAHLNGIMQAARARALTRRKVADSRVFGRNFMAHRRCLTYSEVHT